MFASDRVINSTICKCSGCGTKSAVLCSSADYKGSLFVGIFWRAECLSCDKHSEHFREKQDAVDAWNSEDSPMTDNKTHAKRKICSTCGGERSCAFGLRDDVDDSRSFYIKCLSCDKRTACCSTYEDAEKEWDKMNISMMDRVMAFIDGIDNLEIGRDLSKIESRLKYDLSTNAHSLFVLENLSELLTAPDYNVSSIARKSLAIQCFVVLIKLIECQPDKALLKFLSGNKDA